MTTAISVCIGMGIGNFLYAQFADNQNWGRAIERTFFQAIAIGVYAIALIPWPAAFVQGVADALRDLYFGWIGRLWNAVEVVEIVEVVPPFS